MQTRDQTSAACGEITPPRVTFPPNFIINCRQRPLPGKTSNIRAGAGWRGVAAVIKTLQGCLHSTHCCLYCLYSPRRAPYPRCLQSPHPPRCCPAGGWRSGGLAVVPRPARPATRGHTFTADLLTSGGWRQNNSLIAIPFEVFDSKRSNVCRVRPCK